MKTIEEHNKEAAKSEVMMYTFKSFPPIWIASGIMCPCGCEKELLEEKFPLSLGHHPVKCPKTERIGRMIFSDALRGIIKEIEWD